MTRTSGARSQTACPVCGHVGLLPILALDAVPVQCTQILQDVDEARGVPRGDMRLSVCERCSYVGNVAFEADLVEYDGDYENSQFFSPSFQAYATDLARHLIDDHGLGGGVVVEIGSGKGEFLAMLCRAGTARGIGFDPSYGGEVAASGADLDLEFVTEFYGDESADGPADLVSAARARTPRVTGRLPADGAWGHGAVGRARAVPGGPQRRVHPGRRRAVGRGLPAPLVLRHAPALRHTVEAAGFAVTDLRERFDGQFLSVEATPTTEAVTADPDPVAVGEFVAVAEGAGRRHRDNVTRWEAALAASSPEHTVLWGAGAKGVMFLNAVAPGAVGVVVDVNPRKWGSRVPGTAQEVIPPGDLPGRAPLERVIVSNAAYEAEVRDELATFGVAASVSVL